MWGWGGEVQVKVVIMQNLDDNSDSNFLKLHVKIRKIIDEWYLKSYSKGANGKNSVKLRQILDVTLIANETVEEERCKKEKN